MLKAASNNPNVGLTTVTLISGSLLHGVGGNTVHLNKKKKNAFAIAATVPKRFTEHLTSHK